MGRQLDSLFATHFPYLKEAGIGSYNWGLVQGKTQTHFPWGWSEEKGEPDQWFHDILHTDGTPYDPADIEAITTCTGGTYPR